MINAEVIAVGGALPLNSLSNDQLSEKLDTSHEWIVQRTGICKRHIANDDETTSTLAVKAALNAMNKYGISADQIDLIIVATVTPDRTFPSTACLVQRELGVGECIAFDVSAACSGFVYALDLANMYIKTGRSLCALVIGAETFSKIVDWKDRSTCVLFGDGAGAVILRATEKEDVGIKYSYLGADGSYADSLTTNGGVSTTKTAGIVVMNGREVFKHAVEKFKKALEILLKYNNMTIEDVDMLIPHQANVRIIDRLIEDTGISRDKVVITVGEHANTSAASIPLAMNGVESEFFNRKNVVLLAMGGGFTWGATLIKF